MSVNRVRDNRIMLTLTEEEKAQIERDAAAADMNVSAYCRLILLNKTRKRGEEVKLNGKL
jgi:hypothetical protein